MILSEKSATFRDHAMAAVTAGRKSRSPRVRGFAFRPSIYPPHDARCASPAAAVILAENLAHQPLFAPNAQKEQRPEPDKPGRSRNPIRQEQSLSQGPQPEGRIHRMSHAAIDAAGHQAVLVAHFQRYRPIASKIPVRAMKQP